jgi:hypothetical protein
MLLNDISITYQKKKKEKGVEGFTNTDWASFPSNRRFAKGYFTYLSSKLGTWKNKK